MFQVIANGEIHYQGNESTELIESIKILKKEKVSPINEVRHHSKRVYVHTKGRYEKNYRVTAGTYSEFEPKPETPAEITETDEARE